MNAAAAADHWGCHEGLGGAGGKHLFTHIPPGGRYRFIYFIANYATPVAAPPCSTACTLPRFFLQGQRVTRKDSGLATTAAELAPRRRVTEEGERRREASVALCRHAESVNCGHEWGFCRHGTREKKKQTESGGKRKTPSGPDAWGLKEVLPAAAPSLKDPSPTDKSVR